METQARTQQGNKSLDLTGSTRNIETWMTQRLLELLMRVEGEYREMPGLSLTVSQAERLWRLDRNTCAFVLATLSEWRVLRRTREGTYLRGGPA